MPELPEVETTRRGIMAYVEGQEVKKVTLRRKQLRWPIPASIKTGLSHQVITAIRRRAKYLLLDTTHGSALIHLGMSGSLRLVDPSTPPTKHDHVDLVFTDHILRFNDPRRFGCLLWQPEGQTHHLLQNLGMEPLVPAFDGDYLWQQSRTRHVAVKSFIMNQHIVVGVGNIYASEALFLAGIHPSRPCHRIALPRYRVLADTIQTILEKAITAGGTTLRDFTRPDGNHGYFKQQLHVYGHAGEPCPQCATPIRTQRIGQRNTFYCPHCQH